MVPEIFCKFSWLRHWIILVLNVRQYPLPSPAFYRAWPSAGPVKEFIGTRPLCLIFEAAIIIMFLSKSMSLRSNASISSLRVPVCIAVRITGFNGSGYFS